MRETRGSFTTLHLHQFVTNQILGMYRNFDLGSGFLNKVTQVSKLVSNRYIYMLLIFNLRKCFKTTVALDINKLRQEQMT